MDAVLKRMGAILNSLRQERSLPKAALIPARVKLTRSQVEEVAIHVWMKYPKALNVPDYRLGELELHLVQQEIDTRVHDLERGIVMTERGVDVPWNLDGVQDHVRDRFKGGND